MTTRVLVIEDEDALRELLQLHLSQMGFQVKAVSDSSEAWDYLSQSDLIVLDWMLPSGSGLDWLKRVRQSTSYQDIPVLMLTARAREIDKVEGLEGGADDYVTKPFSSAELVARIRALARRTQSSRRHELGSLLVDEDEGSAYHRDKRLDLTRREFDLLAFLAAHPKRIFSRTELLDNVWGEDFLGTDRTVDQHIAQLRAHIGVDCIETVRGRGYRLNEPL